MGIHEKRGAGIIKLLTNTSFMRRELEKSRSLLYKIAYSWCHNPALADDLVQETMLKALRKARQLKNTEAVNGWLSKILANCWYDYLRRTRETVDLAGFSYVEIADILDIPVGTVMSRISRARTALRIKLADYDPRQDILRAKIRRIK